jgi:uncharacterized membrane protein YebE (DUF533 family)
MEENKDISKTPHIDTVGYKEGAIAGALVGVAIAIYLRKSLLYGGLIGLVGGGYIGYISTKNENQQQFKRIIKT